MSVLLDTHILLWWMEDDARLSAAAHETIQGARSVWVSVVNLWEIILKTQAGKLRVNPCNLHQAVGEDGFTWLTVRPEHVLAVARLAPHHQDPFDRLLVAQAGVESLHLLTADRLLSAYGSVVTQV